MHPDEDICENECLKSNWSVRQLQRQIGSLLF
jgi:predicted nuclease of restriction endonuclease-like (RecB) superfamily